MSRCAGYPTKKLIKELERKGFVMDRTNEGHAIYERKVTQSVSIPIHNKEVKGVIVQRLNKEYSLGLYQ